MLLINSSGKRNLAVSTILMFLYKACFSVHLPGIHVWPRNVGMASFSTLIVSTGRALLVTANESLIWCFWTLDSVEQIICYFILQSYVKYAFTEILDKVKVCQMCHGFYQFKDCGMPKITSSEYTKTDELRNALEYVSVLYSVTDLTCLWEKYPQNKTLFFLMFLKRWTKYLLFSLLIKLLHLLSTGRVHFPG